MDDDLTRRQGRREFLRHLGVLGGGALLAGHAGSLAAQSARVAGFATLPPDWKDRMGLQVYTVRDRLFQDFEGTLGAVADAGYREVELFGSLGDRTPQQVRAILDRVGLSAPSTHIGLAPGPELERQLEGYRVIGHRYTAVSTGGPAGGRRPGAPPAGGGGAPGGAPAGAPGGAARPPRAPRPPQANRPDEWHRQAEALNKVGEAGKPYGIRALVHNHTHEFAPLEGASGTGYDILLAETDPELVAMELDIGWARVAGQDPLALFRRTPGRFQLWHVKDMADLAAVNALPTQAERQRAAKIVPVGKGDIDYRPIFAAAEQAGLQHYFVEQDTAPQDPGGSLAAIRTSAQNLQRALS
jgi:sugar phosphate isomerase/epimerase